MLTPYLSVVLALHGQRALTEQCLVSLRKDAPAAEVVCVDNASPDDTLDWLRTQPGVEIVPFPENRGVSAAWNAGLRRARGTILCVLNNDVIIHRGGMRGLAQAAEETGIAAFCGGVLNDRLEFARHTHDPGEADYPNGCALAFRREVYEHVGEFDEGLGLGYYEDADWGLRARLLGYTWQLLPDVLTHLESRTSHHIPETEAWKIRNQRRFRERWQAVLPQLRRAGYARGPAQLPGTLGRPHYDPALVDAITTAVLDRLDHEQEIDALAEMVLDQLEGTRASSAGLAGRAAGAAPRSLVSPADLMQLLDYALFRLEAPLELAVTP